MPFVSQRQVAQSPGVNIYYHAESRSALRQHAASNLYYVAKRKRHWWGRSVPSVTDMNATDVWLRKGDDTLIMSKAGGEISEKERRISQAGSTIGVLAAPAAMLGAIEAAKNKEGGAPRKITRLAVKRLPKKNVVRRKAEKVIGALDKPTNRKLKVAAAATGAGVVGIQGLNIIGDTITARAMGGAKKDED